MFKYFQWNRDVWITAWIVDNQIPVFDPDKPYLRIYVGPDKNSLPPSQTTTCYLQMDGTWQPLIMKIV